MFKEYGRVQYKLAASSVGICIWHAYFGHWDGTWEYFLWVWFGYWVISRYCPIE